MDHFGSLLGDFLGDFVQHVKYQIQPLFTRFGARWGHQEMYLLNYVLFSCWQLLFDAGFGMYFHKFEPLWASKTCLVDGANSRGEWPGGPLKSTRGVYPMGLVKLWYRCAHLGAVASQKASDVDYLRA